MQENNSKVFVVVALSFFLAEVGPTVSLSLITHFAAAHAVTNAAATAKTRAILLRVRFFYFFLFFFKSRGIFTFFFD